MIDDLFLDLSQGGDPLFHDLGETFDLVRRVSRRAEGVAYLFRRELAQELTDPVDVAAGDAPADPPHVQRA